MRFSTKLIMLALFFSILGMAQTTVFTDDFNRGSAVSPLSSGGTPTMTWTTTSTAANPGNSYTTVTTDPNYVLQIYGNTTTPTAG
jgi:hypothetical protein